jgi:LysR family pca operon transcriptional activator
VLARAGHPLFARRGAVTAAALRPFDLVLPTVSQRVGQEIEHLLALLGLAGQAPLRSSSYGFIREMLLATDHLSVMPRSMMVGDILRGTLRVLPLPILAPPRPAGLVLPASPAPSPAAGAVIAVLRAYAAEIARHALEDMQDADTGARGNDRPRRGKGG